jgi:hypothetical protein
MKTWYLRILLLKILKKFLIFITFLKIKDNKKYMIESVIKSDYIFLTFF